MKGVEIGLLTRIYESVYVYMCMRVGIMHNQWVWYLLIDHEGMQGHDFDSVSFGERGRNHRRKGLEIGREGIWRVEERTGRNEEG